MSDKPLGWRPFTEEERAKLRESFTEDGIDQMEAGNIFAPPPQMVASYELCRAMMRVLVRRLGDDFRTDVRDSLVETQAILARSASVEDNVEARIIGDLLQSPFWSDKPRDQPPH
ncbi:hypothetical protein [Rhizorhabdus sp.]|uniref:hypothetical protein n=1 Tax=Rhizorhabdus sp. TaxID=1968843 RepID=UPI0035B04CFE